MPLLNVIIMDRGIEVPTQSIQKLLESQGWKYQLGGDYYFGDDHPHLHLRLDTSYNSKEVEGLRGISSKIKYLGLTFNDGKKNIDIIKNGKVSKSSTWDLEIALKKHLASEKADKIQAMVNAITGLTVNYNR